MDNELLSQIAAMLEQQSAELKVFMENEVTKRIDSLFDGYQLTHEKQWALEQLKKAQAEAEKLKNQIDDLQARLTAIEKKLSA